MVQEWNWVPFCSQEHPLLKANLQVIPANHGRKRQGTKENETTWANHDHHGQTMAATTARGGAPSQTMVASGRRLWLPRSAAFWRTFLVHGILAIFPSTSSLSKTTLI